MVEWMLCKALGPHGSQYKVPLPRPTAWQMKKLEAAEEASAKAPNVLALGVLPMMLVVPPKIPEMLRRGASRHWPATGWNWQMTRGVGMSLPAAHRGRVPELHLKSATLAVQLGGGESHRELAQDVHQVA